MEVTSTTMQTGVGDLARTTRGRPNVLLRLGQAIGSTQHHDRPPGRHLFDDQLVAPLG